MYNLDVKKGEITKIILKTVAGAGLISVALVAPNALMMFKLFDKDIHKRKYYIKNKTLDLVDKGLLKFENKNGNKVLRLTERGKVKLYNYERLEKPKTKWDKKWRVIIYDVWENDRNKRDAFRFELKNFGFKQLQQSVWIYPYDCEDFITLLKAEKKFGNNVRYLLVEKIENDSKIKKSFKL
jgi:DNA-binding transcriptional regulator PaaX